MKKYQQKKPWLISGSFSLLGLSVASCTFNFPLDKTILSLSTPIIGSMNYALEEDNNPEVLRELVEPLITPRSKNYIARYLKDRKKMELRTYQVRDADGELEHGIDFDPTKIQKDADGYWKPNTPIANHPNDTTDIWDTEGDGWKPNATYQGAAADILVELIREKPIYSLNKDKGFLSQEDARIIRLHIRDDLKWSNGTKVTAQDYVTTMKYVLDPTKGSSWYTRVVNDLKIVNANKCYNERAKILKNNPKMRGEDSWDQAVACQSQINPLNQAGKRISNTGFGLRALANNWLEIEFESGRANLTYLSFGNPALLPINQEFINSLPRGILDFGLSKERFLTNGAMKLSYFRPDYRLQAKKNEQFWNAKNIFSSGIDLRLVTDPFARVNLFRHKYISEISSIPPEFLPILNSDPNIAKTIRRGAGVNVVSQIIFSPAFIASKPELAPMNDPDFRRALYYGVNRVDILNSQNLFGVIPSGLSFPATRFVDYPASGNDNLYTMALNESFTPDHPDEKSSSYKLAIINSDDRLINKFSNYLGEKPVDLVYKPELAKKFMQRWYAKWKKALPNPALPFEFSPEDEPLAINLQRQWETLFQPFNFTLDLKAQLATTLSAKIQTGQFASTIYRYDMTKLGGRSSYNWLMPFATTTFFGDRRFANLTLFSGDTVGAYARRLAQTEKGIKRLKELGFDPTEFGGSTKQNLFWKLLQKLDEYNLTDSQDISNLPKYGNKGEFYRTQDAFWKRPQSLQKPSLEEDYVFHMGLKVGSNNNYNFVSGNLLIDNPMYVNRDSEFGIINGTVLNEFYLGIEKLIRDGAFNIPINSYSGNYYANILIGKTPPESFGIPGNLNHAYRYDAELKNADGTPLPGEELLDTVDALS